MPKFSGTKRRPLRPNLTAPIATTGERTRTHEGGEACARDPESVIAGADVEAGKVGLAQYHRRRSRSSRSVQRDGTGLPGVEDHDEMGVLIETPEQILGQRPRRQINSADAGVEA